jgi:hypothetical protein
MLDDGVGSDVKGALPIVLNMALFDAIAQRPSERELER